MSFSAQEIREKYLKFFESKAHKRFRSYPVVPPGDATLLFTNAGMVQFKDVFTGATTKPSDRATSSQKCLRVSGKHNDLEEVGVTARHHTFFEMLGNFSFGDYFKRDAITWAWELLTNVYGLDEKKLYATVFAGEDGIPRDEEAALLWSELTPLPQERILYLGAKDNFWAMGDTGPCGPCSEILYDQGPQAATCGRDDCPATCECGRYLEIWNLVFMQFIRSDDGDLQPLPKPSIDTGMGLERLVAVLQGKDSNYHTDLFMPLLERIAELVGKEYTFSSGATDVSMRVVADHARAAAFLIAEGVLPSNEGRGYVLRRIMRRAIRHGHNLGLTELFFSRITDQVVASMQAAYPELVENAVFIQEVVNNEEKSFRRTLETGLKLLHDEIHTLQAANQRIVPGETVFKLYDTFGFPKDLTELIAKEQDLTLDEEGFNQAMEAQRNRAGSFSTGKQADLETYSAILEEIQEQHFVGYTHESQTTRDEAWSFEECEGQLLAAVKTKVVGIIQSGKRVTKTLPGEHYEVIVEPNPFYGEAGGQVGDKGLLFNDHVLLTVDDCIRPIEGLNVAVGKTTQQSAIEEGMQLWAGYFTEQRLATRSHHSATHLLHAALQHCIGEHVRQAGSMVSPERLRFDYTHFSQPTEQQLHDVENYILKRTTTNHPITTEVLSFEEAKEKGAMMLFGEKYGDTVRVVSMADSMEFCGGTHAVSTQEIDPLIITKEEALAAGVRRIEAYAGKRSLKRVNELIIWFNAVLAELLLGNKPQLLEIEIDGPQNNVATMVEKHMKMLLKAPASLEKLSSQVALMVEPCPTDADGEKIIQIWRSLRMLLHSIEDLLKQKPNEIESKHQQLLDAVPQEQISWIEQIKQIMDLKRSLQEQQAKQEQNTQGQTIETLLEKAQEISGVTVVTGRVDEIPAGQLRKIADDIRSQKSPSVICLVRAEDKVSILVAATKDIAQKVHCGNLVKDLAQLVGGRGGGKDVMAQAGGPDVQNIEQVLPAFMEKIQAQLGA